MVNASTRYKILHSSQKESSSTGGKDNPGQDPHSAHLVSIILPTYNEVENIVHLITAIDAVVKQNKEIIVVDDNSPDGTSQAVAKYITQSKKRFVRLETRFKHRGLTNSIKRGIELSRGGIVVWLDCDFSMPPALIPKLITQIDKGFDIAVGSRFAPGGRAKSEGPRDSLAGIVLSKLLNAGVYVLLGHKFHDYTSGFIAVRKDVLKRINLQGDYGEYFIDLIVRAFRMGYNIIEIPYVCAPRRAGLSKTGSNIVDLVKIGRKYLVVTARLWFMYKIKNQKE